MFLLPLSILFDDTNQTLNEKIKPNLPWNYVLVNAVTYDEAELAWLHCNINVAGDLLAKYQTYG